LVDSSIHPVSRAIKKYLNESFNEIELKELTQVEEVYAQGVKGEYNEKKLLGGNLKLLNSHRIDVDFESDLTVYHFAVDGVLLTSFELEDGLKEDAEELMKYFKSIDVQVVMATGDNKKVALTVANKVGIESVYSEMSPLDKANYVSTLKNENKTVVMIGDGINDALALSHADVAIVMGSGADVALAISDVVILNNSLKGVKESFLISRRTYKFIKQNLLLSLMYNILTIPLAMAGYVIPLVAALSMSLSSLLVVGNSARIKLKKLI